MVLRTVKVMHTAKVLLKVLVVLKMVQNMLEEKHDEPLRAVDAWTLSKGHQ